MHTFRGCFPDGRDEGGLFGSSALARGRCRLGIPPGCTGCRRLHLLCAAVDHDICAQLPQEGSLLLPACDRNDRGAHDFPDLRRGYVLHGMPDRPCQHLARQQQYLTSAGGCSNLHVEGLASDDISSFNDMPCIMAGDAQGTPQPALPGFCFPLHLLP